MLEIYIIDRQTDRQTDRQRWVRQGTQEVPRCKNIGRSWGKIRPFHHDPGGLADPEITWTCSQSTAQISLTVLGTTVLRRWKLVNFWKAKCVRQCNSDRTHVNWYFCWVTPTWASETQISNTHTVISCVCVCVRACVRMCVCGVYCIYVRKWVAAREPARLGRKAAA